MKVGGLMASQEEGQQGVVTVQGTETVQDPHWEGARGRGWLPWNTLWPEQRL